MLPMHFVWKSEPDWKEPLWRYLKLTRFISMVRESNVYFASANQFHDPFEGAVAVLPPDFPVDPRYKDPDHGEIAFRELKRLTKINCWHRAEYESEAMWRMYEEESKGVAICSTADRIRAAYRPFRLDPSYGIEDLWVGDVRYVNLLKVRLNAGMEERFFYKHQVFSSEREFRVAISGRSAEEFGIRVPELGIQVGVDVEALVERIMLGPSLPATEQELIIEAAKTAGLVDRIAKSSLYGTPRYV